MIFIDTQITSIFIEPNPSKKSEIVKVYQTSQSYYVTLVILSLIIPGYLFYALYRYFELKNRRYRIFTDRIQIRRGLIREITQEYRYTAIRQVTSEKSLFGRLFNYGTVTITLYTGESIRFEHVDGPVSVLEVLKTYLEKSY